MIESCEQYIAMIAAAVVGDLDADHRRELDVHLSSCGRCAEEYRLYRATIEQMRTSAAAVAPPRHFFVYPEERRSILQSLGGWAFGWRTGFALAAFLLLAAVGLALTGFQLRAEDGVYSISFYGKSIPSVNGEQKARQALRQELIAIIRETAEQERARQARLLDDRLKDAGGRWTAEQRQMIAEFIAENDRRIDTRVSAGEALLEARTKNALDTMYRAVQTQRVQDLARIRASLVQAALKDEAQDSETQVMLDTLVQVAELNMRGR
jgi:hypothetical protein